MEIHPTPRTNGALTGRLLDDALVSTLLNLEEV